MYNLGEIRNHVSHRLIRVVIYTHIFACVCVCVRVLELLIINAKRSDEISAPHLDVILISRGNGCGERNEIFSQLRSGQPRGDKRINYLRNRVKSWVCQTDR